MRSKEIIEDYIERLILCAPPEHFGMLEQTLNIPLIFHILSGSGNNLIVGDVVLDLIGTNITIHLLNISGMSCFGSILNTILIAF